MTTLPSKELLSEVLGINVKTIYHINSNPNLEKFDLPYSINGSGDLLNINIYELACKCKKWAKNYTLVSAYYFENGEEGAWCCLHKDLCAVGGEMFEADTEEEAIFKACDYILNELSNK